MNVSKIVVCSVCVSTLTLIGSQSFAGAPTDPAPEVEVTSPASAAGPFRRFPSILGAASAVAAPGGTGFTGVTYVHPRNGIAGNDGDFDFVVGGTVGNALDNVAVTGSITVSGTNPFGDAGAVNLAVSRLISAGPRSLTYLGASANNLLPWGEADKDNEDLNVYASHVFTVGDLTNEYPMQITFGYGNNARAQELDNSEAGFFGGVGIGLTEWLSASAAATESQYNLGVGLSIPGVTGLGITAGVLDVGGNNGEPQTLVAVAYGF